MSTSTSDKNTRGAGKRFLAAFFAVVLCGLLLSSAIVAAVDPFFIYHDPIPSFPYVVDNQLSQNIGMAEHFTYDSVITGSSMTMNFNTGDLTELMGLSPLKLTMNGAYPRDISRILDATFRGKNDLKAAFIAIDPSTWTADEDETKYPYPEYLYDRNPLDDVKYLWNMDVLLHYCIRPMAEREPTDLRTVYSTDWEDDMYYTLDWILDHYDEPEPADEETPEDAYAAGTLRNLDVNLLTRVREHPETEFFFFFPPYSVLYWHNAEVEGHLDATLAQERLIAQTLLAEPNVRIFMFQDLPDIVTAVDGGYMDEIHFRPWVNRYMCECFADGTCEVTDVTDMDRRLANTRGIIENFDFERILK